MSNEWLPMETAPRDGRQILCTDGENIRICYPKRFPRPIANLREASRLDDMGSSKSGDKWEFFRDYKNAPGHTWSMVPTHWMPLPQLPEKPATQADASEAK